MPDKNRPDIIGKEYYYCLMQRKASLECLGEHGHNVPFSFYLRQSDLKRDAFPGFEKIDLCPFNVFVQRHAALRGRNETRHDVFVDERLKSVEVRRDDIDSSLQGTLNQHKVLVLGPLWPTAPSFLR